MIKRRSVGIVAAWILGVLTVVAALIGLCGTLIQTYVQNIPVSETRSAVSVLTQVVTMKSPNTPDFAPTSSSTLTPISTLIVPNSSATELPTMAVSQSINRVDTQGFIFELQECKGQESLTCYFMITNTESQDKEILLSEARMFDNLGNEYNATYYALGNKKEALMGFVSNTLISRVPLIAQMSFKRVSPDAASIEIIKFRISIGHQFDYVEFRNIPIIRK